MNMIEEFFPSFSVWKFLGDIWVDTMGSTVTEALLSAAMSGETNKLKRCIQQGANVNARDIPLLVCILTLSNN